MKTLVIGTGTAGCTVAIAAANAGMETALLARSGTAAYIREHGLKRTAGRDPEHELRRAGGLRASGRHYEPAD